MSRLKLVKHIIAIAPMLVLLFLATAKADSSQSPDIAELAVIEQLIVSEEYSDAISAADSLLHRHPDNHRILFLKAAIHTKTGDTDKAVSIYEDLLTADTNLAEAYNNLAVLYAETGDYNAAISTLESAFKTSTSYSIAYSNLKAIYDKLASDAYKIALNSETPPVPLRLASIESISSDSLTTGDTLIANTYLAENSTEILVAETELNPEISDTAATETEQEQVSVTEITVAAAVSSQPAIEQVDPDSSANMEIEAETDEEIPTAVEEPSTEVIDMDLLAIETVKQQVEGWAQAWASMNLDSYLSFYSDEFHPQDDLPLDEWKTQRKERLQRDYIVVELSNLKIDIQGNSGSASFTQYYKSNVYEGTGYKTLKLRNFDGVWLITDEII